MCPCCSKPSFFISWSLKSKMRPYSNGFWRNGKKKKKKKTPPFFLHDLWPRRDFRLLWPKAELIFYFTTVGFFFFLSSFLYLKLTRCGAERCNQNWWDLIKWTGRPVLLLGTPNWFEMQQCNWPSFCVSNKKVTFAGGGYLTCRTYLFYTKLDLHIDRKNI